MAKSYPKLIDLRYPTHPLIYEMEVERIKRNLSYSMLAKKSGVAKATIAHWSSKQHLPHLHLFECVLKSMGLKLVMVREGQENAIEENVSNRSNS